MPVMTRTSYSHHHCPMTDWIDFILLWVCAAPGFIASLVRIIEERDQVPTDMRLLAAIVAKNTVGSRCPFSVHSSLGAFFCPTSATSCCLAACSWRKMVNSREWSRVPAEEKAHTRTRMETLVVTEPSDQVPAVST